MTLYFPLAWRYPNLSIIVFQEAYKMGADVGIVLNPHSNRQAIDLSKCSGLPIMVDNGAYSAWKKGMEPNWDKAKDIAEEVEARFIVALDKIGDPEESLKLSLETFKTTYIEKIVPFQAVTLGKNNWKMIKQHLRRFMDAGVRVLGIPCPAANSLKNMSFAVNCRWLIPLRCHGLGYPFTNPKYIVRIKYFESADGRFWEEARAKDRKNAYKGLVNLYNKIYRPDQPLLSEFSEKT